MEIKTQAQIELDANKYATEMPLLKVIRTNGADTPRTQASDVQSTQSQNEATGRSNSAAEPKIRSYSYNELRGMTDKEKRPYYFQVKKEDRAGTKYLKEVTTSVERKKNDI